MKTMTLTGETPTHLFYETVFEGQLLKLIKDKATDELFFDSDSFAVALGYPDTQAMLADERALNAINNYALENGGHSIRQANGNPIWI